ncbi:MAG: hypothetical protein QF689_18535 [Candidatus Latescibacteria bacterium]|nr:hypothetical protein [Candidatus Latescibacterota bacterium]MDP7450589.1 hypothetical protein [Candidatus Latescibacterota bacterium]HJP31311.1 hypothetical protein [Candidatus Latescibacterota bacterium]
MWRHQRGQENALYFGKGGGLIMGGSLGLLEDIPYGHAVAMLQQNLRS